MSQVKKEENKKHPSKILGLDISTSCIGVTVISDDGVNEPIIDWMTHVIPKIPKNKNKNSIEALILRKDIFERDFLPKIKELGITDCVIESPLEYSKHKTNIQTVSQLIKFNALLSEAVYRTLNMVPSYITSHEARIQSFPELLSLRKFNKKGELYSIDHVKKAIEINHLVPFGSYPFDCDKKSIMMDLVCERFPHIEWVVNRSGDIKKENYDACDSLVCALAYSNTKRYGELKSKIGSYNINKTKNGYDIEYTTEIWGKTYPKKLILNL